MSAASPRLRAFGWTAWHAALYRRALEDGGADPERCRPARVATVIRHLARLVTGDGETTAFVPGKMRATAPPVVGDWVVLEAPEGVEPVVREVLERRTKLSRKVAGQRTEEQVMAANLDTVFVVMGLDGDFNLRRLERLAVVAHQSGAEPVVVLTKADLLDADELAHRREAVEGAAPGVSVFAVSSPRREGLEPLRHYLAEGRTVVLLGSSGAGKSTLLNTLVGEEVMRTAAVREGDDRGRHTTSHRELVPLPGGGLLIDGPGIREVQLWVDEDDAALGEAFADVEALAAACRFRDCTHRNEPGCAVREAVEAGDLDEPRLDSYRRLQHEMEVLERRKDTVADRKFFKKQGALYKRILAEKKERE
jgi:ribosome biogenesis GTPase